MTNQILSTLPLNPGGEVSGWGLRAAWVGAESSHVRLDSWRLQGPTAAGESHQICACNDLFSLHPTSDVFHLTNLPEQELAALMRSLLSYGTSNIVNGNAKLDRESHTEVNIEQA